MYKDLCKNDTVYKCHGTTFRQKYIYSINFNFFFFLITSRVVFCVIPFIDSNSTKFFYNMYIQLMNC